MEYENKYIKYKNKYLNQIGGRNNNIQFILFSDVLTGHSVWFHDHNNNKIDFVKKLKKLRKVIILKPNYVNFMNIQILKENL